ncbi:molybdate ABC transporter substrate-binding protein [Oceanicoccus sagamiensis]|uniref:Molybdate ABC transporter substrate-binding protein n=1 Tax=Oceanicoccus sagamiensis TaxID=716816 RepID=A0A1X9NAZ5_9GAMM|nr:molybdate ABC transporter substrate-binding protein [Oceanicoccus sagamiensis]ARN74224.1 molybdate ABC transporter substrate-binding protein [Oceanicoccus sagamiensis]
MRPRLYFIGFALCLCNTLFADTATVAVATNFKGAIAKLNAAFQKQYPEHQLRYSYASSGTLFNQIIYGAPFDMFLSADSRYPTTLEQRALGAANSRSTYAIGRLVAVTSGQIIDSQQGLLATLDATVKAQQKVAIANPDLAPYGVAAKETLQYLKRWQSSQASLVKGSNIGQTFQFVATGNAPIGLAALSQVKHLTPAIAYWPIPQPWYQPIRQQMILLQSGENNQAAISFLAFLKSEPAKQIIRQQGYEI